MVAETVLVGGDVIFFTYLLDIPQLSLKNLLP